MSKQHEYHLKVGKAGEQQLDNLDRFFGATSREFLRYIGLKSGMQVLDVGCGIGNLSCWMAEIVGASGRVVAVDSDNRQLELAQERADSRGIQNILFQKADAHNLSMFANQFDLVYCRSLLIHVKKPMDVLKSMAGAVRAEGLLACEEGELASTTFYYPDFACYRHIWGKLVELLKITGNDTDIALNIFKICKTFDGFSFDAKLSQTVLDDLEEIKTFTVNFALVLDSAADALIKNKLLQKEEIEKLRIELKSHSIDKDTLLFLARMTQVWCRRDKY